MQYLRWKFSEQQNITNFANLQHKFDLMLQFCSRFCFCLGYEPVFRENENLSLYKNNFVHYQSECQVPVNFSGFVVCLDKKIRPESEA